MPGLLIDPPFILPGFAFPGAAMHKITQRITRINPPRHFLVVLRFRKSLD
jgi:hypothetical protein